LRGGVKADKSNQIEDPGFGERSKDRKVKKNWAKLVGKGRVGALGLACPSRKENEVKGPPIRIKRTTAKKEKTLATIRKGGTTKSYGIRKEGWMRLKTTTNIRALKKKSRKRGRYCMFHKKRRGKGRPVTGLRTQRVELHDIWGKKTTKKKTRVAMTISRGEGGVLAHRTKGIKRR